MLLLPELWSSSVKEKICRENCIKPSLSQIRRMLPLVTKVEIWIKRGKGGTVRLALTTENKDVTVFLFLRADLKDKKYKDAFKKTLRAVFDKREHLSGPLFTVNGKKKAIRKPKYLKKLLRTAK